MQQQRHQPCRLALEVVEDSQPASQPATTAGISSPFLFRVHHLSIPLPSRALSFGPSSGFLASSPFPPLPPFLLPLCLTFIPPQRLLKRYTVYTHRLNVSPTSLTPTLRYPSSSTLAPSTPYFPRRPVAGHPPIPSNPAYVILATVYYAHVLTERRTSDLRESPCNPLRARHPPD